MSRNFLHVHCLLNGLRCDAELIPKDSDSVVRKLNFPHFL